MPLVRRLVPAAQGRALWPAEVVRGRGAAAGAAACGGMAAACGVVATAAGVWAEGVGAALDPLAALLLAHVLGGAEEVEHFGGWGEGGREVVVG